ncbi:hypothetical protein VAWG006_28890 [Aeromonas enteropelogenes]|nr:hypothetical protein VAWG006_28890 [Aeromonas enteropelogenes]BEE22798.1 hypothetical protein VAWG007_28930 [Aeromonas enteropelogenes]
MAEILPPHLGPLGHPDHPVLFIHHINPFHVQALLLIPFDCPQYIGARDCDGTTFSNGALALPEGITKKGFMQNSMKRHMAVINRPHSVPCSSKQVTL